MTANRKPKAAAESGRKLTPRVARFVEEYLIDLNGAQAAIRAGYSSKTARVRAAQLLANANVQAAVTAGMAARSKRTEITQDMVLKELAKLAFSDPRKFFNDDGTLKHPKDLDDHTAAALAQFEVTEEFDREQPDEMLETQPHGGALQRQYGRKRLAGYTTKVKWADKRAALVDIGKLLGMFIDRKEIRMGELEKATDQEIARKVAQAAQQVAELEGRPVDAVLAEIHGAVATPTMH